jgi:hypothetical protein
MQRKQRSSALQRTPPLIPPQQRLTRCNLAHHPHASAACPYTHDALLRNGLLLLA